MTESFLRDSMAWLYLIATGALLPFVTIGTIRKVKARMQNRVGASIIQPLFDLMKLLRKSETVSQHTSWIFRWNAAIGLASMIVLALLLPWLSWKPVVFGCDLFLVVYLFAMSRFFAILAALDSASPFGAFGASREATISMLVEPASLLALAAPGIISKTSDLNAIFSLSNQTLMPEPGLWILIGSAILLSTLVELSRMPVDDPTTHLELTMIHEAMILEASGRNLALIEYGHAMKLTVLFGLASQCFLRSVPGFFHCPAAGQMAASVLAVLVIAVIIGIFEGVAVKLHWRKVPEFISYCMTLSLLAGMLAVAKGLTL